jgi:exodeoxyribonuclease V alpha subunit
LQENNIICWNEEKTKIGLTVYYNLEQNISNDLLRLLNESNQFEYKSYDLRIKEIEKLQGFDFTEEQLQAIKLVADNQVSIITGYGGTGKSSVVSGVLQILGDCSFAQTALSGRAASRLSEITNEDGYTIHRLLEYNPQFGFQRNKDNPLDYDIIILDEISMVGADLFYRLIQAIKSGSKLIMIGDDGQLESIGLCNIFNDMLESDVIPVARLTKIHRQAAKSAIITESIKVRNHEQLVSHKWVGEEIRGELQDLELNIYNDKILSQKRMIEKFNEIYNKCRNTEDIQIVVPMRTRGEISALTINEIIQNIVNPFGNNEISLTYKNKGDEISYKLREKDKVIVNTNNYKTKNINNENCPVFNGNRGVIESINEYEKRMVVDFEQWGRVVIEKNIGKQ